jgi:opacity protein-like surface antigen
MLRKGIAAAALIAASTSIFAGGIEVAPAYIGGAYVDVGLSRDDVVDSYRQVNNFNISLTVDNELRSDIRGPNDIYRIDAGAPGWDGFVGVGYNYVWGNEWSVGLEVFGDLSSAHGTQLETRTVNLITGSSTVSNETLRMTHSIGVSLMPGYFVAPGSLYFMELGYVNSEFELNGYPRPYSGSFYGNPSRESDQSGFRLGFGTTTQVGSHVAVRQEYVWEFYGNVNASNAFAFRTPPPSNTIVAFDGARSARVSPDVGKYNLAAVYYFARQGNSPDMNTAPAHVGGHFYAGLNGSYDEVYSHGAYSSTRSTTTVIVNTLPVVVADGYNGFGGLMNITGWNVGLLAGYGVNFTNRWYTGFELFGNYDDVDGRANWNQSDAVCSICGTTPGQNVNSRLEKEWDFGAAFLPGYQVSDNALLYARVGYVGAEFENTLRWIGNTNSSLTTAQRTVLTNNRDRSKWLNGLQLGVGVDTLVYQNLSLRTEFNINNYGNYNSNALSASTPVLVQGVPVATTTTTISSRHRHNIEDQFNVALIWHFFD